MHLSRRLAFTVAAGPALAWIPLTLWLHANLDQWIASGVALPLAVRLALHVDNVVIRTFPIVVLAIALAMPLLAWSASKLEAPSGPGSLAVWLCLSLGLQVAGVVAFRLVPSMWFVAAALELWWAGIVAYVLAFGAAVAVQRDRWAAGRSSWRPRTVLWLGWLAMCVGGLGFLVPALVWLGAYRDGRRVEVTRS